MVNICFCNGKYIGGDDGYWWYIGDNCKYKVNIVNILVAMTVTQFPWVATLAKRWHWLSHPTLPVAMLIPIVTILMIILVMILTMILVVAIILNPPYNVIDERPKSTIERRKRNFKFFSPISREERETWHSFLLFREEKEKSQKIFSTFERRKRNGYSILKFQEEKEKVKTIAPFSRREREILNALRQFWEEKEKSRVHNVREEKEKFSHTSYI